MTCIAAISQDVAAFGGKCSRCDNLRTHKHRYCNACHAEYMRGWRKNSGAESIRDAESIRRANIRAYTNTYQRRGLIPRPGSCEKCGSTHKLENHHLHYDHPFAYVRLCRTCHLAIDR